MRKLLFILGILFVSTSGASIDGYPLEKAHINPNDNESLRRGATLFANYCFNCHSVSLMRYSRIGSDLDYDEAQLESLLVFTGAKVGDLMENAMQKDDAKRWFGVTPPDLSVVSRSRGVDWLYTYLRSFYRDPSRPWGVNNAVFKDVAMPHVLWELQGLQDAVFNIKKDKEGVEHEVISDLLISDPGKLSTEQYDNAVRDIVNFLHYLGEPTKQQRLQLGGWVILYLAIFFVVMFLLKKEFWKDVKKSS